MPGTSGRGAPSRSGSATAARRPAKTITGTIEQDGPAPDPDALAQARAEADERALADVQALAEGLTPADSVEFLGRRFRIASKVGLMPLMGFAAAADSQLDTSDMAALAAVHAMLKDCFAPEVPPCGTCEICAATPPEAGPNTDCPAYDKGDWHEFRAYATAQKAGAEELLPVVQQTIQILTSRPTTPPRTSSREP